VSGGGNNQGLRGGASSWGLHVMQRSLTHKQQCTGSRPLIDIVEKSSGQVGLLTNPCSACCCTWALPSTVSCDTWMLPCILIGVDQHHHS
jgi:hypothetical protein